MSALTALDARLADAVRAAAPESMKADARTEAESDLVAYRTRLNTEQWAHAVAAAADRALRDRLALPFLTM